MAARSLPRLLVACCAAVAGFSCSSRNTSSRPDPHVEPANRVPPSEEPDEVDRVAPLDEGAWVFADAPVTATAPAAKATLKVRKSAATGSMDELACNKALKALKIPHVRAPGAAKIGQPIVVTGPIGGVDFDTGRPYEKRTAATGDAIDCRLAVALVDLAHVVKKHGVTTVLVKSFHRPGQKIVDAGAPLRHRIGFAIDVSGFKTKSGEVWNVQKDFHGKVAQATCGAGAAKPIPDSAAARELWSIFCQIVATEAFDSGISPNYNAAHFDHVHFDLTHDHPILFFP